MSSKQNAKVAANEPVRLDPQKPHAAQGRTWVTGDDLLPGDAYREGPYIVFTAQFHLRRGYCCNSDCRHCPYK